MINPTVTHIPHNGALSLSAIVANHLVQRQYYYYTVAEAKALFREEFSQC